MYITELFPAPAIAAHSSFLTPEILPKILTGGGTLMRALNKSKVRKIYDHRQHVSISHKSIEMHTFIMKDWLLMLMSRTCSTEQSHYHRPSATYRY